MHGLGSASSLPVTLDTYHIRPLPDGGNFPKAAESTIVTRIGLGDLESCTPKDARLIRLLPDGWIKITWGMILLTRGPLHSQK